MNAVLRALRGVIFTLRLALPKIGAGWMFALLTSNFNRISIVEFGVTAAVITVMIGMHHFLSPFQVIIGRTADRYPIFGYRRTPYFVLGGLLAASTFVFLPGVAAAMGQGQTWAYFAGFGLLFLFGVGIAATGDSHHSLIAEITTPERRGIIVAVVWTFTIISAIAAAIVIKVTMGGAFEMAQMQSLYQLTPVVVLVAALPIFGLEPKRSRGELQQLAASSVGVGASPFKSLGVALDLIKSNAQVRAFFGFVFFSILGVFLQDAILEVFGAEVFGMSIAETAAFSSTWGAGVLGGMMVMGVLSSVSRIGKKTIGIVGGLGTAFGLGMLTLAALTETRSLLNPALLTMGLFTGFYNVGALSMMMEMTVEGSTGLYMGMWGMAQAFGMGAASFLSGALKTVLIESGMLAPALGYTVIFGLEVGLMVIGVAVLRSVNIAQFKTLSRADLAVAMEHGAVA